MKKLLLVFAITFSLNLSASVSKTWECNDIIVSLNDDNGYNTMTVGEYTYEVSFQGDDMFLHSGGRNMLRVTRGSNGGLVIYNVDNTLDMKEFTKCI